MKSFLLACGLLMTGMLSAATPTLNVDLTVTHGVYSDSEGATSRKVVFLVIDRSGSMGDKSLSGDRTPNEALVESLKLQLAAIPRGTEVHVIPFSSTIWEEQTYKSFDEKARKAIVEFVEKKDPKGQTVLYDAEDLALSEAAKIMDRDANAEVRVLVYTDGEHLTPWNYEGEYKACYQNKTNGFGKKRFENNPNYRRDLEVARKKFKTRFAGLISRPNMEVEYEWLSETDKPETDMVTKTPLPTELRSQTAGLANPLASPAQTVKGVLHFPISDKCWEEVKGRPISLDFEVGGKHVTEVIKLEPGQHSCKLAWPALPTDEPATAKISLSRLPCGTKFELKEPKPLQWCVPAQGRVSVEVTSPAKDAVVAFGSKVSFMAKASDQADVRWAVGPTKRPLTGASADWTADVAGTVPYSVTASKTGFKSATASRTLEVIRTGVKVTCGDRRHELGKESVFQAEAVGPCLRYVWTVDGNRVSGEDAILRYCFEKESPGDHQIGVTAFYKNNLQSEPAVKTISVAPAPRVEIRNPLPYEGDVENAVLQAEKKFELEARVEGGLTEVRWQFKLKDKAVASVLTEVKGGKAVGSCKLPKGGYYDVVATGKGPAGEKASEPIQIFVKSAEIRVDIKEPKPNDEVETGKGFTMRAAVKGPVKSVRWRMIDRSTARPIPFGVSDETSVIDGMATMTAKLPLELGNRSVTVEAEPVLADQDLADTVAPSVIAINAKTAAGIAYTSETMGLNWKKVKYDEQVKLSVTTSGAIKKVAWFTCDGSGKEVSLGKEGPAVNVDIEIVRGQSERHIDYFAKGQMPDGSWIPVDGRITIVGYCNCGVRGILLPKGNDGLPRSRFRLGEKFSVALELADGARKPTSVNWLFGDGGRECGLAAEHAYGKDASNLVIRVDARCPSCDKLFTDAVTVSCGVVPPRADFEIRNYSGSATCGSQIELDASKCEGDVADYIWTVDGQELKGYRGKKTAYVKCGRKPSDLSVCLTVAAPAGYQPEVPSCQKPIRVRFGWWAAVPAVLVLLLLVFVVGKLLFGNAPRKWNFYTWEGSAPKQVNGGYPGELGDAYLTKGVELTGVNKWNFWTKKGRIRLANMLMLDDCGDGGNVWQPFGEEEFEVRCLNGAPLVRPPDGKFDDVTGEVNLTGEAPYFLFRYIGLDYADDIANGHDHLRVRVVDESGNGIFGAVLFLAAFGLLIWGFVEFCLRYAI